MIKQMILIITLIMFLYALFVADVFAGYAPEQTIEIVQPEPNIAVEVIKWGGGVVGLCSVAWFTYYLNNRKKKDG